MAQQAPKIIAIGLNSADPELLIRWSDADALHNLAALHPGRRKLRLCANHWIDRRSSFSQIMAAMEHRA